MRSIRFALVLVAALVLLPLVALAAPVPPPDDLSAILSVLAQALTLSGPARWFALLFVGVMVAVWLVRKVVPATSTLGAFVRTDEGGAVVNVVVTAAGTLLAKVLVGGAISWPLAGAAFVAAAGGTSGLWTLGRRLLRFVSPLVAKIPGVGPSLARILDALSGARVKAEIQAATDAAYKPGAPLDARAAAAELSKPPSP